MFNTFSLSFVPYELPLFSVDDIYLFHFVLFANSCRDPILSYFLFACLLIDQESNVRRKRRRRKQRRQMFRAITPPNGITNLSSSKTQTKVLANTNINTQTNNKLYKNSFCNLVKIYKIIKKKIMKS